jgi:hypothetical protein
MVGEHDPTQIEVEMNDSDNFKSVTTDRLGLTFETL